MKNNVSPPTSLKSLVKSFSINFDLISQMTKREIIGRYKGSILGLLWAFFNPLFMLSIYTFIFSVVFKARWGTVGDQSKAQFAMILFVGMIVHTLFMEVLTRAPVLVTGNVNFVKKIIFPLEVLPFVSIATAIFHSAVSLFVLVISSFILNGYINWTILLIPVVLFPFILFILGIAWILSSLGVYFRDVGPIISLLTTVLMFASPVFYPISSLPIELQSWVLLNPLSFIIEESRKVIIFGEIPNWNGIGFYTLVSLLVMKLGYFWFQKTKRGFANVL